MSVIYYRFKSGLQNETVKFDDVQITVGELRSLIMQKERMSKKIRATTICSCSALKRIAVSSSFLVVNLETCHKKNVKSFAFPQTKHK